MSWSGFKKNVGRATTQVMMKTGQVEKTSDRQYEVEERRYRTLESASLRLQKEAKGYLDSLRAMTASQMRIAETIDAFYGDSGATDGVSRSYKQAVEDLDAETVKALDGPYRCVPSDLRGFAWDVDKGVENSQELRIIEWEMNRGVQESFAGVMRGDMDAYGELMDFIYRTTVLEPINRFCAYFPDINECIKKRQHKMLDYDSMRAKVKRLTEKPDKDPAKLPRAEKEQDMVSLSEFLYDNSPPGSPSAVPHARRESSMSAFALDTNHDYAVPSPPKALNGIRQRLGLALEHDDEDAGAGAGAGAGTIEDNSEVIHTPSRGRRTRQSLLARTSSIISNYSTLLSPSSNADSDEKVSPQKARRIMSTSGLSTTTPTIEPTTPTRNTSKTKQDLKPSRSSSIYSSSTKTNATIRDSASTRGATWPRQTSRISSARSSTPWFEPSELEEIMAPLKVDFMRRQADRLSQAKEGYNQLNEQLMSELPQLIDLRFVKTNKKKKNELLPKVPYLDPTFEALVKIQLRFCAEAYSRMAQVQQYLDASTRDQYASGDLDARVEDVLGQIRELSIAGTV
ncbi:hypothetical protein Q7P37_003346 [Cladosporium fusiforme]